MLKLFLIWLAWMAFTFVMMAREPREQLVRGATVWTNLFMWSGLIGLFIFGGMLVELLASGAGSEFDDRQYRR